MTARLVGDVNPQDFVELMWVRDVADHTWEIMRYRGYKRSIIESGRQQVATDFLDKFVDSASYLARSTPQDGLKLQRDFLVRNADTFNAEGLVSRLGDIERVERLIALAEGRRNSALREIEMRRAVVAARLRHASDMVLTESDQIALAPRLPSSDDVSVTRVATSSADAVAS
jgi:hypothetical protein